MHDLIREEQKRKTEDNGEEMIFTINENQNDIKEDREVGN